MNHPATGRVAPGATAASPALSNGTKAGPTKTLLLAIDRDGSSSPCTTSG